MVDAVVLVIRHGKSSKNVMRRARDLLVRSGAPMAGLVLNAVDLNSPEYYGYYGYSGLLLRIRRRRHLGDAVPHCRRGGPRKGRPSDEPRLPDRDPTSPRTEGMRATFGPDLAAASRRRARCLLLWALAALRWLQASRRSGRRSPGLGAQAGAVAVAPTRVAACRRVDAVPRAEDFKLRRRRSDCGAGLSWSRTTRPPYAWTGRQRALLPFIGSVNVRGLTVRAAQVLIADRLRTGQFYKEP
jgi:hypothetical protein